MGRSRIINWILFSAILILVSSCHVGRFFYWNLADVKDCNRFPSDTMYPGQHIFNFDTMPGNILLSLPVNFNPNGKYPGFEIFLKKQKTIAFMIIRKDTIIYEKYFSGYDAHSILPSFSVAKAYVSALTGFAIDEGYISSVDEPVTNYLDGFKDERFEQVTIRHLLNMRSGIKFNEGYFNPFGHMAKFYYGTNLEKYTYNLKVKALPDSFYSYLSCNTQIIAMILEEATGKKLPDYLQEKIWIPLGMESFGTWNYDSKKHHNTKSFCCINATARDFAKFGRLYMQNGEWDNRQILSESWIDQSTEVANDSKDSQGYSYVYQWRVKDDQAIFAKGILGQFIYVDPEREIIILRFGKKAGKLNWPLLFEDISKKASSMPLQ